ncbi:CapA family protein [Curtobacterium sp. USHLN213]|uniref:CapA family protein n=1 Tax=Curtobacterium sp. USHLN213 TaxID=3081255 RepID=UPI003019ADD0
MNRDTWGDAVKGLLIVLVVFWHVVMKSTLQVDWHIGLPVPGAWGMLGNGIWPFLMPAFLLVSGVYAANALHRPWTTVVRPRVVRFLYLYLLWTLIHAAAMWAFPDFPTLVPRSLGQLVEALTISPPNTWYLYALALYFLVAKALRRVPAWVVIAAAATLSVLVATGYVEVVSNRGSLLYNATFFLLGAHLGPRLRGAIERVTPPVLIGLTAAYAVAFALMLLTGSRETPGVWPVVSVLGVAMVLAAGPFLARVPHLGPGLAALGRRTLPIYLLHMPLLAVVDAVVTGWLSSAHVGVQLVAAVLEPVVLTSGLVAGCLLLARLVDRDGARWLFELPRRPGDRPAAAVRGSSLGTAVPWRITAAVALLVACSTGATRATAIAGCAPDLERTDVVRAGEVSIGAVGDVLLHDVGHTVPDDGGASHFDAVRPWFTQDIVTGNLEQPITEDTGYDKCGDWGDCLAFRSDPETAEHFDGFDLLNLANNHTSDFGAEGYANTASALAAVGIDTVGARNQVTCGDFGGTTVAAIGFSPYAGTNRVTDLRHVRKVVTAAAATAYIVVAHAHMGAEGPEANRVSDGPETMFGEDRGDPRAFARAAIDAGADLVIGHGPHSLRGIEVYQGQLIAYSLGNFGGGGVFGAEQATRYGAYLDLSLRRDGSFARGAVRSVVFDRSDGRPRPDPDGTASRLVDDFGQRDFPGTAPTIDADGTVHVQRASR